MSLPSKQDPLYFFGGLYAHLIWKLWTSFRIFLFFAIIDATAPISLANNLALMLKGRKTYVYDSESETYNPVKNTQIETSIYF